MKKILLFALLLASINLQPLHAVQTGSPEDEAEALKRGKKARNVCSIHLCFGTREDDPFSMMFSGSGTLIEPDLIITAAHIIHSPGEEASGAQNKKLVKKLKKGKPVSLSGFVTFAPNVKEALAKYQTSRKKKYY